ncbi:radical SAM protein [Porphyromonas gingivalis]|uniref:radical SAM protein n=1 Tax=Porphyromonas gingivalis TaxID=837 RepID=UPI00097D9C5A|nr:radical SAM protein [Porphyromonas gingivalis]ATR93401.1 radical SAM protein [Porphyromonas gingivalis]ATS08402.1 radical SAM protein [Porphyromonas gingivalis]
MKTRKIYEGGGVAPCYFRTTTCAPYKKAILQITERCNLHCKHCFVSAQHSGCVMSLEVIREHILQRLLKLNVIKVSLTGGEPFTHPNLFEICLLLAQNDIEVTICTNATLITKEDVTKFAKIPRLKFNVSLDGFSFSSHGRFRGLKASEDFEILLTNIRNIGKVGKLNGLLCTPNFFCEKEEFENICQFGKDNNAKYVLFNPLSRLGRGQKSLRFTIEEDGFDEIRKSTNRFVDDAFEVLYIRFPNREGKPLPQCVLGDMIYIFTNGDTTLCPYMVFASKNARSPYSSDQFIIGNIISNDLDIDKYVNDSGLNNIVLKTKCSKEGCYGGCHAAKIMNGNKIDECDWDLCPIK